MYNFNAGPAALPPEVLQELSEAVLNFNGSGFSIAEIPHRGAAFKSVVEEANHLVKELGNLGDDFEVVWVQGGGRMAFCMIPMNFIGPGKAAYIDSGHWSEAAIESAKFYGDVLRIGNAAPHSYTALPEITDSLNGFSYVHLTSNNTIEGTQWHTLPNSSSPLVVDMSSDVFSREVSYQELSMFYAVAQKNLGAAGVTMLAIRKDFLAKAKKNLPEIFAYHAYAKELSLVNTPPVMAIYTTLLNLRWIKEQGLAKLINQNKQKANLLYDAIAQSTLFHCPILPQHRSNMNVVFTAKEKNLEQEFLSFATQHGLYNIAGHRSVGGFRVSLYNAITLQAVKDFIACMQTFEEDNSPT